MTDLWPEDITQVSIKAPVTILKEQAEFLKKKTKGIVDVLIVPSVKTQAGKEFIYGFDLVSPALNQIHYRLFTVAYDIHLYPAVLYVDVEIATEIRPLNPDVLRYWEENTNVDQNITEARGRKKTSRNIEQNLQIKLMAVTQGALIEILRDIFASNKARQIIQNFIAQVVSDPKKENPFL